MNSNAFSAADMTTAAASGHRDGYQAGYADAVKAVEVGQPAAAQEAVYRATWTGTPGRIDKSGVEWRSVVGFEQFYEVSSEGRIFSLRHNRLLSNNSIASHGYIKAFFHGDGKRCQTFAHRAVAEAFLGPAEGREVNHLNGIRTDNRAENLDWVTRSENEIHSRYILGNLCEAVIAVSLRTGARVIFRSQAEAEAELCLPRDAVRRCLVGDFKSSMGWRFEKPSDSLAPVAAAPVVPVDSDAFAYLVDEVAAEHGEMLDDGGPSGWSFTCEDLVAFAKRLMSDYKGALVADAYAIARSEAKRDSTPAAPGTDPASSARIAELEAQVAELDRLCDATYVAQGADAYNYACELMEQHQAARHAAGKEVGTQESLCDGLAWLYGRLDELEALIDASPKDDVPRDDLVPGVMRCAKCSFQLHRTNLYLGSGTTGPGDSKTEPCPNGCGPLWPVTWQTWATEGWEQAERYHEELRQLQDNPKSGSEAVQIPDTDGVREILGRMCFQCIRLAEVLRLRGDEIGRRAEDEQAAVLRFLLNHYLAAPEKWAEHAQAEIDAIRKQATSAEVGVSK